MKKGFTLIELIAIIVILAIIALISTPVISDIIYKTRVESFKNTANGLISSAGLEHSNDLLMSSEEKLIFTYTNGVETSNIVGKKLEYTGKRPDNGVVVINEDGDIAIAIHNGTLCAIKDFDGNEVIVSKVSIDECIPQHLKSPTSFLTIATSNSDKASTADYVVPNGSLDSQTIINQAIIDANANNKGLLLYDGTYTINNSIVLLSNTYLQGEGSNTVIKLQNNYPTNIINLIENNNPISNVTISNLVIDGNKDYQDSSYHVVNIKLTEVTDFYFNKIEVKGSLIEGIYLYTCSNGIIDNINSYENGYFREDASGIQIDNSNSIKITNSIFNNNGFHGIILSSSYNNEILNTTVQGNGWDGVRVQWESKNNKFDSLKSENNFRGIYFLTASEQNNVTNSLFDKNYNGICFNSSWENIINHNSIGNSTESGVLTVTGSDYNYFRNNTFINNTANHQLFYDDQMMP